LYIDKGRTSGVSCNPELSIALATAPTLATSKTETCGNEHGNNLDIPQSR